MRKSLVSLARWLEKSLSKKPQTTILDVVYFIYQRFALALVNLVIFLVEIPIHLRYQPTACFVLLAARRPSGEFIDSYYRYLQRYRIAVATALASLLIVIGQVYVIGFGLYSLSKPNEVLAANITVSGTLYSDEGVTAIDCSALNRTITVKVNGAGSASAVCSAANGTWSVGSVSVTAAADVITVYVSTGTDKAVTITRAADNSSNITGLNIYQNHVVVRHEDSGPITNANLGQWDNDNDATIPFTSNANALIVNSGVVLYVWSGKTYTPGGSITTNATGGDIHLASSSNATINTDSTAARGLIIDSSATLTINSGITLTDNGTVAASVTGTITGAGTLRFTSSTTGGPGTTGTINSIVRFDATAANIPAVVMVARTYGGDFEAYSNSGVGRTWTPGAGTFNVSGNFKIITGASQVTQATFAANTNNITVNITGNLSFTVGGSGTPKITTGSGTWTVSGNMDTTNGFFTASTNNTLVMNGAGKTLTSDQTFYNLTISANDVAVSTLSPNVTHTLTVSGSSQLTINTTVSTLSAATVVLTGTIAGSGTLNYQGSAAFPSTGTISSVLTYQPASGAVTITTRTYGGTVNCLDNFSIPTACTLASGSPIFNGDLTIQDGGDGTTLTGATNNPTVTVAGSFSASNTLSVTLSMGSGTWSVGGNFDLTSVTTFNNNSGTLTMNGTGTLTSAGQTLNNLNINSAGTVTLAAATHTVAGNLLLGGSGTPVVTGSTITMTGTAKTIDGGGKTLNNLTINGTETLQNTDLTVSAILNIGNSTNALTINSGRTVTLSGNSGTTLNLNSTGTVTGAGTLVYQNSATTVTTSGTISSGFTFDLLNGNETVPSRTFGGAVVGKNTTGSARTLLFGVAVTPIFSSNLDFQTTGVGTLLIDGATNNPTTVTVAGNVTASTANGAMTVSMGSGNWAVAGNFDLTNVTTFNHNSGTLTMNGTGTLTTNGKTLNNFTTSGGGTITLANATHTIAGNLNIGSTGLTAGTSTIVMNGSSKTIDGGGKTLNNLTISGTITVQNTNLTVSGTLGVDDVKTLALNASRTLTLSGNSGTTINLNTTGAIIGAGKLIYQNSATTLTTAGTISSALRFDLVNGNMNAPARALGGAVEVFNNSGAARTLTPGTAAAQALVFSSNLDLQSASSGSTLTLATDTNNPSMTISGNFTTSNATAAVTVSMGAGTWTVAGNFDLTNVTTFNHNGGTLTMSGTGTLTSGGQSLNSLTISAGSTTITDSTTLLANLAITAGTLTAPAGTLNIGGNFTNSATFTHNSGTVVLTTAATAVITGATTFNNLTSTVAGKTLKFQKKTGSAPVFTFAGTLTLSGTSGSHINLQSDTAATQWLAHFNTAQSSVTNVTLQDSGCDAGTASVSLDSSTTNAGNNGTCWFFPSVTVSVNDGTGADSDLTNSSNQLSANWTASPTGSIAEYRYAIGTTIGGTDMVGYTSTGLSTSVTKTGLSLMSGTTYYVTVRAINGSNATISQGSSDGILVDDTAPAFSNLVVTRRTDTLVITWNTNEPATTHLEYGLTSSYDHQSSLDSALTTDHAVTISGLASDTTYHFRLLGTDRAGNAGQSTDNTTSTTSVPSGSTVPVPTLTSIAGGGIIVDTTPNISGTGPAGSAIFIIIDRQIARTVLARANGTFSVSLITPLAYGRHAIALRARTADGQVSDESTTTSFTIFRPTRPVTILERIVIDGGHPSVTFRAVAQADTTIEVYLDGKLVKLFTAPRTTSGAFGFYLTVIPNAKLSLGRHSIYFIDRDQTGKPSLPSGLTTFTKFISSETPNPILKYDQTVHYFVQVGNSLWSIARSFYGHGILWPKIQQANFQTFISLLRQPWLILPGWNLRLPP